MIHPGENPRPSQRRGSIGQIVDDPRNVQQIPRQHHAEMHRPDPLLEGMIDRDPGPTRWYHSWWADVLFVFVVVAVLVLVGVLFG